LNNSIFPMDRPGKIAATSRKPSRSSGPRNRPLPRDYQTVREDIMRT
jgi:hypothetical protein